MNTSNAVRLWIQATPLSNPIERVPEASLGVSILGTLFSSGVGVLIKSAADKLMADNEYTLSDVLAFEPAFRAIPPAVLGEFWIRAITINVGPKHVELDNAGNLSKDAIVAAKSAGTVVIVRVEFELSRDGTALAGRVTHWVYEKCLDDRIAFRDHKRKVTIEIKVSDVSGASLLATAMQVTATTQTLAAATPASGERLPWAPRPSATAPPGDIAGFFGPVNIQVRITEAAGPSWLGRLLGSTLSSQKGEIETYVKDTVTQATDPTAAAQANLGIIAAAQAAWTDYMATYQKASAARETFEKDDSPANQQLFVLSLAVLHEYLELAREAHKRAGLEFHPLSNIAAP